jgi:hypothetical protein
MDEGMRRPGYGMGIALGSTHPAFYETGSGAGVDIINA